MAYVVSVASDQPGHLQSDIRYPSTQSGFAKSIVLGNKVTDEQMYSWDTDYGFSNTSAN